MQVGCFLPTVLAQMLDTLVGQQFAGFKKLCAHLLETFELLDPRLDGVDFVFAKARRVSFAADRAVDQVVRSVQGVWVGGASAVVFAAVGVVFLKRSGLQVPDLGELLACGRGGG